MRAAWVLGLSLVGACGFDVTGGSAVGDGGGDPVASFDGDVGTDGMPVDDSGDAMAAACPNRMHWEADFSSDPRTVDSNGDALGDWAIRGANPNAALPGQLDNGVWRVPGNLTVLDSQPKNNFDGIAKIHVRMRANEDDELTDQWGSVVWLNAGYGDGHFAPIMISVTRLLGQQSVRVLTRDPTTGMVGTLLTQVGLGSGMLDIQLKVDTTLHSVALVINNSPSLFSFFLDQNSNVNDDRWASLTSWDVETEVDLIEIENCP